MKTQYQWKGFDRSGLKTQGVLNAQSLLHAKATLQRKGVVIHLIRRKRLHSRTQKIKPTDVMLFSRQLATLIQAGIPLVQSFEIIAKGLPPTRIKTVIETIKNELITGTTLSQSLRQFPEYFNDLYCNLIEAGEKSGTLEKMFENIASYKEKVESIKRKVKTALTYPIAVIMIALLVTTGLLIFVVPQFESLFKSFNASLPTLTIMIVMLSQFFQHDWFLIFSLLSILTYAFVYLKNNSTQFQQKVDYYLLFTPIIGPLIEKVAIARFARTLSITFAAGLPLLESLKSVAAVMGNRLFSQATEKIGKEIASGQQLQLAMAHTQRFPNMVIQMVAIGEESGSLETMLSKIADFYETAIFQEVEALSGLLEPIIMSILGLLVGGFIVAMYLPIFKLGSVM